MTDKTNLTRSLDGYQARRGQFRVVHVPEQTYLMLDGHGDPNTSPEFTAAVETLFPVAYALKFASKRAGHDYVVPPLEGLWWSDDPAAFTTARDASRWDWTLLLLVPSWVDAQEAVPAAVEEVRRKRTPPRLDDLRVESLAEGCCVQTLHVGPFADEGPVLAHLHDELIPSHGLTMTGHHHEIYLSDLRRVEPARQRTILRQPVTPTIPQGVLA